MASWWRLLAEQVTPTTNTPAERGSWKRRAFTRVAAGNALPGPGTWERRAAQMAGLIQTKGSWTRRMTPTSIAGAANEGGWERRLHKSGQFPL